MTQGPLDRLDDWLPNHVRRVVDRETPIPTIALAAGAAQKKDAQFIRADIGQIVGLNVGEEVLYGPPSGLPELREALAETWRLGLGLSADRVSDLPDGLQSEHIAICTGAAEGLSILLRCFARGRRVGLPRGHWENYANGVDLAEGEGVIVDFFNSDGDLDCEALAQQIRDQKIEVLVTNFPCNPTGAVLQDDDYRALGKMIEDTGVVVVADEVYNRLRFDGAPPRSLVGFAPANVVAVSSASKEFLLPGGRVGYVVSTRPRVTDHIMKKMVRAHTASPNVLGQKKLLGFLNTDLEDMRAKKEPRFIDAVRLEMAQRRDQLLGLLEKHGFGAVGRAKHRPEGTIFLMASLPKWWSGDDAAFAKNAIDRGLFSCIPGSAFGLPGSVRFSYGAMGQAEMERLDSAFASLSAEASSSA